jgi:hypothetical protein
MSELDEVFVVLCESADEGGTFPIAACATRELAIERIRHEEATAKKRRKREYFRCDALRVEYAKETAAP